MDTLSIIQGNNYMVFANWALVIATMVLALITFFYMRHTKRLADDTKRMADIMVREFELKVVPIIDIQIGSRMHSSQGFGIQVKIFNRGFYPVRTGKILMRWWYKKGQPSSRVIEKNLNKLLDKDNPITETLQLRDDEVKNPDVPETQNLNGYHLGRIVAASIWLEFDDMTGKVQRTREILLDPLMT